MITHCDSGAIWTGVSGPDNDLTIFPTLLCGPKISGPDNDQMVWSLAGPGRCLVLLHWYRAAFLPVVLTDSRKEDGRYTGEIKIFVITQLDSQAIGKDFQLKGSTRGQILFSLKVTLDPLKRDRKSSILCLNRRRLRDDQRKNE